MLRPSVIILITIIIIIILNFCSIINSQHLSFCESLNDIEDNENENDSLEIKSRRIRALCDAIYSSRIIADHDELDSIPDFDLTQINSDIDANQILKRFRRGRFSGGGRSGGGRFSGGSRFSSGSRSSSSGGSRFFGGSRSSSSSGSSRFFGRSGSSSSSSGSRIFSRSSGSSSSSSSSGSGSSSSSSGGGFRFFSRTPSSSNTGHRVRDALRSVVRKPSSSGVVAGGSSVSSNTGSQSRVRQAVRSMFRHSAAGKPSGSPSASGGLAGGGGSKPGFSDKIRKITHGTGGFGSGSSGFSSGIGGASGSGGNVWVRAGKKFLPHAVRFGKRYYERRKYNKGMYTGIGAGTGYYAGSHMGGYHHNHGPYYSRNYYNYPPVVDNPPEKVDGKTPTVFYCIQEDLNTTLVNQTLNAEGFGVCNVSGALVTCPIEIECQTSEADNCCEDEQGTPYCCGGPIPEEYASQYGGYGDDTYDAAESINKILNIMTALSVVLATICFTMWHRRGQ